MSELRLLTSHCTLPEENPVCDACGKPNPPYYPEEGGRYCTTGCAPLPGLFDNVHDAHHARLDAEEETAHYRVERAFAGRFGQDF